MTTTAKGKKKGSIHKEQVDEDVSVDEATQVAFDLDAMGLSSAAAQVVEQQTAANTLKKSALKGVKKRLLDISEESEKRVDKDKGRLNLVVIGHVDSGKSTLFGHLLYALGNVQERTMRKFEKESEAMKKGSFSFAWVLDETGEERAR